MNGAARWIQSVVLDVKEGILISWVELEVQVWIKKLGLWSAKVFVVLAGMVEVEGALKGCIEEAMVVASGKKAPKELAEFSNLIRASGNQLEDSKDARSDDAGANGRSIGRIPWNVEVKVGRFLKECGEDSWAVQVDCEV